MTIYFLNNILGYKNTEIEENEKKRIIALNSADITAKALFVEPQAEWSFHAQRYFGDLKQAEHITDLFNHVNEVDLSKFKKITLSDLDYLDKYTHKVNGSKHEFYEGRFLAAIAYLYPNDAVRTVDLLDHDFNTTLKYDYDIRGFLFAKTSYKGKLRVLKHVYDVYGQVLLEMKFRYDKLSLVEMVPKHQLFFQLKNLNAYLFSQIFTEEDVIVSDRRNIDWSVSDPDVSGIKLLNIFARKSAIKDEFVTKKISTKESDEEPEKIVSYWRNLLSEVKR